MIKILYNWDLVLLNLAFVSKLMHLSLFPVSAAEKVTGNLTQLTSQVTPSEVCSVYGIRKAMGISFPYSTVEDTFIHLNPGNNHP